MKDTEEITSRITDEDMNKQVDLLTETDLLVLEEIANLEIN